MLTQQLPPNPLPTRSRGTPSDDQVKTVPGHNRDRSALTRACRRRRTGGIEPGLRIGNYVIQSMIARGGFGVVWKAMHELTGHTVAVKILHPDLLFSAESVQRFEREAQAITMVRHPNIVDLYELDRLPDGRPYFVMEFLSGMDLESYIGTHGALPAEEALSILDPLTHALTAVHTQGIVHRDLKALNVFLNYCDHDQDPRVVLLDFGIAKLLDSGGPDLTASRSTVGSPVCMAPEQIRGEAVDPRTDVYALGSLAFQMLTSEMPFPLDSPANAIYMHLLERRPRPSERMDISPAFDEVIVRAMSKEREDRYPDALSFLNAFRRAVELSRNNPPLAASSVTSSRTLGLYIETQIATKFIEEPSDALLDDIESIVPAAAHALTTQGYHLALERGNGALFACPVADGDVPEIALCSQIMHTAQCLFDQLTHRPGRHPGAEVRILLHFADAQIDSGNVLGGPLLDLAAWVPADSPEGVLSSPAFRDRVRLPGELVASVPPVYRISKQRHIDCEAQARPGGGDPPAQRTSVREQAPQPTTPHRAGDRNQGDAV